MGRMDVLLADDLEREFRVRVAERLGGQRGAISKAMGEAIRLWLREEPRKRK